MDRRGFLTIGAAGAALMLASCATEARLPASAPHPSVAPGPRPVPVNPPAAELVVVPPPPAPQLVRVPVGSGALSELSGDGQLLAWTADDGSSAAVIAAYAAFAAQSGTRLTLFVTGSYDAWGVDARPFFRPPFGYHDERVDALAASIGYTVPTLWHGTLSDSGLITEQQVVDFATQWFLPQHIVIGHLNFDPVTKVFPQLLAILQERGLQTVTLNDVFSSEQHP